MSDARPSDQLSLSTRAALLVGGAALRALAATWRYRIVGGDSIELLRRDRTPFIFSLWHGQLLPLLWHHRRQGVAILVSQHRDGEIIARIAASLGYRLIRGSTTRGGERALLGLVKDLRSGAEVAVTPDGPKGPAHSFASGALVAAQRANAPILPIIACVDRAWRLSSWDSFVIPKPFAKITVAYGASRRVAAMTSRVAATEAPEFKAMMEEVERVACD